MPASTRGGLNPRCKSSVALPVRSDGTATYLEENVDALKRITEANFLPFFLAASYLTNRHLERAKTGAKHLGTNFGVQTKSTFAEIEAFYQWHWHKL
jgi:hypothetical protein